MGNASQIFNIQIEREMRSHIVAACDKQSIGLQEPGIQDLIKDAIKQLAANHASGNSVPFDWDRLTKKAFEKQHQSLLDFNRLGIQGLPSEREGGTPIVATIPTFPKPK